MKDGWLIVARCFSQAAQDILTDTTGGWYSAILRLSMLPLKPFSLGIDGRRLQFACRWRERPSAFMTAAPPVHGYWCNQKKFNGSQ